MELRYVTFDSYELIVMGMLNTHSIRRDKKNDIYYQKYDYKSLTEDEISEKWVTNYIKLLNKLAK